MNEYIQKLENLAAQNPFDYVGQEAARMLEVERNRQAAVQHSIKVDQKIRYDRRGRK